MKHKSTGDNKEDTALRRAPAADGFHVVGLGFSAGGLEALEEFFRHLTADTGMAFVVVSHQHRGHVSLQLELLNKYAPIPAIEAVDGALLQPNHIYVSPPGAHLGVMNRKLQLMDGPVAEMPPLPIDFFFRSLAADQQEHAICIVLSGTGTGGTLGLKAVKDEAGMALVQDVQSARFAGMPSSAIATSLADYILPPADMPLQLVAYANGTNLDRPLFVTPEPDQEMVEPLQKIIMLLRSRTAHDFSEYKKNSVLPRIERRMAVHHADSPAQYVRLLQEHPQEIDLLFKELLIGVTSFFRDPEAFVLLREELLPELLNKLPMPYTFRVWIPGCSSGEEAYTMAIVLYECIQQLGKTIDVQIFATDLNTTSIEYARAGRYPEGIAADVPMDLLKRHFAHEDGCYRVRRQIRELIVFAPQNVIKDPPFTKLDLLCCRNLLIYLNAALQNRLLPIFHHALKPGGILMLGPSEAFGTHTDLFSILDRKWKVFRCLDAPVAYALPRMPAQAARLDPKKATAVQESAPESRIPVAAQLQEVLLNRFAPPSLVVNTRGDATIFLDNDLRLKRYTEKARSLVNLLPADVGRPIADLVSILEYDTLQQDARKVLQTLVFHQREVRDINGKWYLLRIMPYRTAEDLIQGLTVTFVEIIATQQEQLESRDVIQYLRSFFDTIREPTLLLSSELEVAVANKAFCDTFNIAEQTIEGKLIYEVGAGQLDIRELRLLLEEIIPDKAFFVNYRVVADFPNVARCTVLLNARQLDRATGLPGMILMYMSLVAETAKG